MSRKPKVCIIGAEGWGSAISTAVCKNAANGEFDKNVHIYVYDELVRSNYLSEVINERHENIKYLPGIKLELNLIAVNDLIEAAKEADVLIFATSHSFIKPYCNILAGKVKTSAYAVSLIKGLDHIRDGEIDLYSHVISKQLNIPCYSMMSANSAMEMAQGKLTEITIGCNNANHAHQLSNLFQTDNCKVCSVDDVDGVELCNTLKDLVALSAGFIDGLRLGENARVTCLHLALKEMMRFIKTFNPNTKLSTFFESCGLANSVASSYADKNVTFAKCFVTSRKTVQEIEANLLNGRKLLGPIIAGEIYAYLEKAKLQDKYPLFTVLHRICQNELPPDAIVDTLRWHPDLSNNSITQLQKDEYKLPISFADSVLENFVDVAPELRPWSDKAKSVDSSIDSNIQEEKVQQIFNVENSKMENSGMEATTALDAAKPNKSDVEFSFEIASSEDKPEIYLTLREGTGNPSIEVPEQNGNPWLYQQNQDLDIGLDNAIGISQNLNNDTSAEYLSIKRQPAEIAHSNESKSSEGKPVVGVSNFIKQHINPLNEKYKALKVRAKVNDSIKASKLKKKLSKSNLSKKKSTEKIHAKENDSKSKSNEMENLKSHYKSPVQKQKQQGALAEQQKMQVLYDEDPTFTKRSADEPSVSKLFDIMRMNASRSYEEELIGHSLNANVQSKSKKNKFTKRNKVMDKASNTMPIIKEGGYRVDYKRVLRSNKKPSPIKEHKSNQSKDNETKIASIVHKVDRVPLQYSNTDNSYRSIKSDLESQSCSEAKYQPTDNDQLNHQKEDKTVFKTLAMAPMSSKGNDSICPEMLYFDGQKNMKGFEEDPKLKYEGKRTENIHDAFKDPNKLIRAQEFLDEQSHLIRNLLLEVAASDSFNNDLTKYLQSENEFLDNKTKNESKFADQKNSPLEEQKPDQAQKFTSEPKINEYQLTHGEPKSEISIEKPQSNKQLPAFDRMATREHLDYIKKEEENKMKYINNVYEDVRDSSDEEILNNNKVLLEKQFPDKGDNKSLVQDKYEMILEKHLPNRDYKSLLADKRDTLLDKSVSKAYDTGLNEFYNSSVDESVEGNSKNFDDHRSSALIKKNQIRGLEDPNLRFYHGKNDGEPGPEWNWLLENEDSKKKSKNSVKNTENRSLDLDDDLLVDSKKQPKNSLKKTGNRNLELDEDLAQHNYQNQFSNEDKQTSRKSMNPTNNNNFSQDLNFPQRSQDLNIEEELNIEEDQALDKAQLIIDEDAQKPTETDGSSPVKFEGKPNEIFMDDANPISKSLSEESSQDTKTSDPIKSKHTDNEDAEVILKDMSAEETLQTDRTVSGLNDKEYEVMAHAVNEFKKILDDVEVKFNSPDALEKNMNQPIDERLAESLHQDEENPEFNTEMKTLMTKGQTKERQVDYSGNDPYFENINTLPKRSTPSHSKDEQGEKMRKKIVIRPSFHPPINPRVRIPHPPFDVRDHEYHTVNYRPPPNLMRSATLPLRKIPVAYRTKQTAASNVVKLPRPAMRLPTSVMRSSVLAVELGIFAAFFSRYRGGCK